MNGRAILLFLAVVLSLFTRVSAALMEPSAKLVWNLADFEAVTGAKWRTATFATIPGVEYQLQSSSDMEAWVPEQTFYGLGHKLNLALFEIEAPPPQGGGSGSPPPQVIVHFLVRPARNGGLVLTWKSLEDGNLVHRWVDGELHSAWKNLPLHIKEFGDHLLFVGAQTTALTDKPQPTALSEEDTAALAAFAENLAAMNAQVAAHVQNPHFVAPPVPSSANCRFYRLKRTVLDTDGDGISDWYELRDFKTDPFKADSDGDGVDDGEEFRNRTNPNNPKSGGMTTRTVEAENDFLATSYVGVALPGNSPVGLAKGGQAVIDGGYSIWHHGILTTRQDPIVEVTWSGYGLVTPNDFTQSSRIVDCLQDEDGLAAEGEELDELPRSEVQKGLESFYKDDDYFVSLDIASIEQIRRGQFLAADGSVIGTVDVHAEVEVTKRKSLEEGEDETETIETSMYWAAPVVHWQSGGERADIPQCYSSLDPLEGSEDPMVTILDYSLEGGLLALVNDQGFSWCPEPSSSSWYPASTPSATYKLEEHSPVGFTNGHSVEGNAGILRLGSGLDWESFPAMRLETITRHGVLAGHSADLARPKFWKKFRDEWVSLDLLGACSYSGGINGPFFLSDDEYDLGAPEFMLAASGGTAVLFLKSELLGTSYLGGALEKHEWSTPDARPTPKVQIGIDEASVVYSGGTPNLALKVSGTVRDPLSSFGGDPVTRLEFSIGDNPIKTIPVSNAVVTGFAFTDTILVENVSAGGIVLRATTDSNGAGLEGWDQVAVSLAVRPTSVAGNRNNLTLALVSPEAPASSSMHVYFGDRAPLESDGLVVKTEGSDFRYEGNLLIPVEGDETPRACNVIARPVGELSELDKDQMEVEISYFLPNGARNTIAGLWEETTPTSFRFRPIGYVAGDEELGVTRVSLMNGSQQEEAKALTLRVWVPDSWRERDGFRLSVGGATYNMWAGPGSEPAYPRHSSGGSDIRYFMPAKGPVPALIDVAGYTGGGGEIDVKAGFGTDLSLVGTLLCLPNHEAESESGQTPSQVTPFSPGPRWRQPGDAVTWEDLMTAYRFIYGEDEAAMLLLDAYLSLGNHISLEDTLGDLDVSYLLRTDGKILIKIEHDDADIHPAACASLLYAGLHKSLAYPALNGHPDIVSDPDFIHQSRKQFAQVASEMTIAAAELYLSGITILNEGLDWALVVNDVSEGHYESLAATLPFISRGLVKAGGNLAIRNLAGETVESLDREALQALVTTAKSADPDLETIELLVQQHGMKDYLCRVLTSDGGFIKVPSAREGLKSNMKRALNQSPPPGFEVHHDLPWALRFWFASHGIDVNDAVFGRYVHKSEHLEWHRGPSGGPFNKYWRDIEEAERLGGNKLSRLQLLQKLAECRQIFSATISAQ